VVLNTVQPLADRAQSNRRQRALSEQEEGEHQEESEPNLLNTQSRHLGRVRKRLRLLNGYKVETL
jgi:hypothetical protein